MLDSYVEWYISCNTDAERDACLAHATKQHGDKYKQEVLLTVITRLSEQLSIPRILVNK